MAEYCPVFADHVHELPENVTAEQATCLDPLTAALHAVDVAKPDLLHRAHGARSHRVDGAGGRFLWGD